MKILIADDSSQTRELIKEILQFNNHSFLECNNGLSAIELYNNSCPDLVLMDISMPKMNGLEASAQILNENPKAKILIVTQFNEPEFRKKAIAIGAIGYITKDNLNEINEFL